MSLTTQPKGLKLEALPAAETPRRWLVLLLYSLVGVLNFGMWLTYATLPSKVGAAFAFPTRWKADLLSVIVGFGYLVGAWPAGRVLANGDGGLRRGMLWASTINVVSAMLRVAGGVWGYYWVALTGQLLVGISQPFFMAAPAQLSTEWFPVRERGLATSVAILSQVLGQALIFVLGPAVGSLPTLVGWQLAGGVALLALVVFLFGDSPVAPEEGCLVSLSGDDPIACDERALLLDRNFGVLSLVSAVCIGTFWTFCTVMGRLMTPLGYTEAQAGLVEFVFIGSGMAGLLSAGPAMDATRRYATLMRVCVWAAAASALALVPVMAASNLLPLLLVCGTLGFVLTAVQAVALETAAQISYPVGESTSSGIVFGLAVAVYCCLPFLVDRVALRTVLSCQAALFTASALLLSFVFKRPVYRRLKAAHPSSA